MRLAKLMISSPATSTWLAGGTAAALVLTASAILVGVQVVPVALAAETRLSEINQSSLGDIVQDGAPAIQDLQQELLSMQATLESINRSMIWAKRFSPAVSWLPMVRTELDAVVAQTQRAQRDLDLASSTLTSSLQLFEIYDDAQAALVTPGAGVVIHRLKDSVETLQDSFEDNLAIIEGDGERGRQNSFILTLAPINKFPRAIQQIEDEVVIASTLGEEVAGLMIDVLEIGEGVQPLLSQFGEHGEDSTGIASGTIAESVGTIEAAADSAMNRSRSIRSLIERTEHGTELLPQLESLDQMLLAIRLVGRGASRAMTALGPAIRIMETSNTGLLAPGGGLNEIFVAAAEHKDDFEASLEDLNRAEELLREMSENPSSGPQPGVERIVELVEKLGDGLEVINDLAPVGSKILGADRLLRYLVLGHSADELRGTGGFVSSIWLITVNNGGLESIQYFDAVRVDDWDRLNLYPIGPTGLEEHMNGWVWLLRDVSWDPDFPTTARSAEDLFRLGQRMDVDGVIAINQWSLLGIIDAIGNVPTPEGAEEITSRNLLTVLEQGTDSYGRAYMDLVLQGVLDSLNSSTSVANVLKLASSLLGTLHSKDTMLYFDDPEIQSVVTELNWDGAIRRGDSDYLFVVDSNVGWSKVDRNVQRQIDYRVDLSRAERPRATLTLSYSNHSGPGSPPCEPQWLSRGTDYSQLKNACYWNYIRVYMPQEATFLSNTPLPLPAQSVAVEIGKGVAGQETAAITSTHGRKVFSGLTNLSAGENDEILLVYDLPESVIVEDNEMLRYRLVLQKQPGVRQRPTNVTLVPPLNYVFSDASHSPTLASDDLIEFRIPLVRDTTLDVEFIRRESISAVPNIQVPATP